MFNYRYLFGYIFQLADVARPGVVEQQIFGVSIGPYHRHVVFLGEIDSEFSKKKDDVGSPFAKRRNPYWHRVESVKKVLRGTSRFRPLW